MISNITKHSNYMSANLKYIETQVMSNDNKDLLSVSKNRAWSGNSFYQSMDIHLSLFHISKDGFLNAKLLECAKKCAEDAVEFGKCAKKLYESLNKVNHHLSRPSIVR